MMTGNDGSALVTDEIVTNDKRWVELRVHGVSGTPPEELLAWPHVLQIDGDERSRFFRAVDSARHVQPAPDGHAVEGFHWGRYTSGSWKQSLWLTLLPFGLINMAAFMMPSPHRSDGVPIPGAAPSRKVALGALRLMAILLTILLSFSITLTLIDVVSGRWLPTQAWSKGTIRDIAPSIATIVAGLVIAVLGGASWFARLLKRNEQTSGLDQSLKATPRSPSSIVTVQAAAEKHGRVLTPFASKAFYTGDADTMTLRGLHVAAGLAVPASIASGLTANGNQAALLLIVIVVVATLLGDKERAATLGFSRGENDKIVAEDVEESWSHTLAKWVTRGLVLLASYFLVESARSMHGFKAVFKIERIEGKEKFSTANTHLVLFDDWSERLLYVAGGTLVVLTVAVVALAWFTRSARPKLGPPSYFGAYSKGCAAIPISGLALFLGVGYAAALVMGVSTALSPATEKKSNDALDTTLFLERVAYAWALAIVPMVLIAGVLIVQKIRSRNALQAPAEIGYPLGVPFPTSRVTVWRKVLASAIWFARVKNAVVHIVWTIVLAGVVLSAAIIVEISSNPNEDPMGPLSGTSDGGGKVLVQVGTWVLLGLVAGMVILARGAFRDATLRRAVNIVWDVVAFWPHAAHPFIPTPYSLRTVGDLAERVRHHAHDPDAGGRAVVVCGHSQGSLVSFAALNLMGDAECARIGYLTFGSQLRLIFARAFPMYVNYDSIERMHDRLGGAWINLYRDTDPLAGPVLSWHHQNEGKGATSGHFPFPDQGDRADQTFDPYGTRRCGDDWRLVDPVPRVDAFQEAPVNALHGHSNYWLNPEWATALAEIRTR